MTVFTSSTGIVKDLDIDIDRVCAYEEEHPEWSLFHYIQDVAKCPRFTDMNLIATFVGYPSFKAWVQDGFSFEQLAEVISKSSIMGFTDSEEEEPTEVVVSE